MMTDILNESTELLFVGNNAGDIVAKAFSLPVQEDSYVLPGVMSRKKQLVPPIIETLQE